MQGTSGLSEDFDLNKAVLYMQRNGIPVNPENVSRVVPVLMELERGGQMESPNPAPSAPSAPVTSAPVPSQRPTGAPVPSQRPTNDGNDGGDGPSMPPGAPLDPIFMSPLLPLVTGAKSPTETARNPGLDGDVMGPEAPEAITDQRNTAVSRGRNNPRTGDDASVTMTPPDSSRALPAPNSQNSSIEMSGQRTASVQIDRGAGTEDAISFVDRGREFYITADGFVYTDGPDGLTRVSGSVPESLLARFEATTDPIVHSIARAIRMAF